MTLVISIKSRNKNKEKYFLKLFASIFLKMT